MAGRQACRARCRAFRMTSSARPALEQANRFLPRGRLEGSRQTRSADEPALRAFTPLIYGIFGNRVLLVRRSEGRRFLGSRRLYSVLSFYSISENAITAA
jgi:hypothetical protein